MIVNTRRHLLLSNDLLFCIAGKFEAKTVGGGNGGGGGGGGSINNPNSVVVEHHQPLGGNGGGSSYWEQPFSQPYFDNATERHPVTTVGQVAYLHCRVRNLGDRAVSTLKYLPQSLVTGQFI